MSYICVKPMQVYVCVESLRLGANFFAALPIETLTYLAHSCCLQTVYGAHGNVVRGLPASDHSAYWRSPGRERFAVGSRPSTCLPGLLQSCSDGSLPRPRCCVYPCQTPFRTLLRGWPGFPRLLCTLPGPRGWRLFASVAYARQSNGSEGGPPKNSDTCCSALFLKSYVLRDMCPCSGSWLSWRPSAQQIRATRGPADRAQEYRTIGQSHTCQKLRGNTWTRTNINTTNRKELSPLLIALALIFACPNGSR